MIERYILVSDDEYVYTLDTFSKDYKTLEDFEKEEMEIAKKEGVNIGEYEEEIFLKAHDKYWEWVYDYQIEADDVNDMLNNLSEENQQLKEDRNELFIRERDAENNCRKLKYENEQLKQRINSRLHFYRELYESTNDKVVERVIEDLEDILKR